MPFLSRQPPLYSLPRFAASGRRRLMPAAGCRHCQLLFSRMSQCRFFRQRQPCRLRIFTAACLLLQFSELITPLMPCHDVGMPRRHADISIHY